MGVTRRLLGPHDTLPCVLISDACTFNYTRLDSLCVCVVYVCVVVLIKLVMHVLSIPTDLTYVVCVCVVMVLIKLVMHVLSITLGLTPYVCFE